MIKYLHFYKIANSILFLKGKLFLENLIIPITFVLIAYSDDFQFIAMVNILYVFTFLKQIYEERNTSEIY